MPSLPRPRLTWIDLLRGVAVVGMLETHVMNVFLDASYDQAEWRHQLSFYNGLLAPAFLWIAGYIQGLSIRKAQRTGQPVVTGARLRRLGFVALIGYLLHVPWHLWGSGVFSAESWRVALQANILQCMAVSLTMLLLAGMTGSRWFDAVTLALAGFFVFAAPAAQHWFTNLPFLDPFINHDLGSLFPLFPWVGFCAVGSLASRWEISWRTVLPVALGLIALAAIFKPTGYSYVHPSFFAERLGWLGLLVTSVWLADKSLKTLLIVSLSAFATGFLLPSPAVADFIVASILRISRDLMTQAGLLTFAVFLIYLVGEKLVPRGLQLAGRESLCIYVSHLVLLYSFPYHGTTLNFWIGRTLSIPVTACIFFLVLVLCLGFAWLNEKRKLRARTQAPKAA